jgi:hypothetical protein
MHMWHHVTNHLIISNDKDFNSENRIKLRVRDSTYVCAGETDSLGRMSSQRVARPPRSYYFVNWRVTFLSLIRKRGTLTR